MKPPPSPPSEEVQMYPADETDDIFGPPRTYPTGYCPPKHRPSMISAKYRQKEERRKVLKISISKLKKIDDPEVSLCRSVLINNTMKKLQKEARDEKGQKQQLNYPRCYDNDGDYLRRSDKMLGFDEPDEGVFDNRLDPVDSTTKEVISIVEKNLDDLSNQDDLSTRESTSSNLLPTEPLVSKQRSFDDVDVQDVLSQFYMPPTPRLLTCIDDDEDVNVVDDEPPSKHQKTDEEPPQSDRQFSEYGYLTCEPPSKRQKMDLDEQPSMGDYTFNHHSSVSCGHASLFCELQSNVYHNLITSLET